MRAQKSRIFQCPWPLVCSYSPSLSRLLTLMSFDVNSKFSILSFSTHFMMMITRRQPLIKPHLYFAGKEKILKRLKSWKNPSWKIGEYFPKFWCFLCGPDLRKSSNLCQIFFLSFCRRKRITENPMFFGRGY